ncbi:hypothetical protein PT138_04715 (plasmid) [Borreliella garinii]|uniref:hypothetical protein n=1 Tax=Borreliella garinii TaxID=29519 RepID=UPI00292F1B1E|nr:hypothetical protein [Borreliella garinii]WNZ67133.1 hypothetical protein PT139_04695 [Borreliella garinii]WNZ68132.1 hypothetical protein PT135_04705 [Borreliella garinii]WNZ69130.1 hypothetical protein PT138_04715 [Borreliella garinii]WNZ71133.1 hypothetical protein PT141_04715 [Borreliella garinii]
MINGNMFILITTILVSCKFYGNDDVNKKNTSLSGVTREIGNIDSVVLGQDKNKKDNTTSKAAWAQAIKHASSKLMLDDPDPSISEYGQKKIAGKLTKEDMDKLKAFFDKTTTYQGMLDFIYNKYTRSYNTIATYSGCTDYSIGCFSEGPSERRSQALTYLENNNLDKVYTDLNQMLKEATHDYYCPTALNDAINEYKETMIQAKGAESKIEKINDYTADKGNNVEKKKENIDNLKKVRDILTVSKKTIESASIAYANAFAIIVSSLSSDEFITAVNEFKDAAEKYANGKGDHAVDVVVGAIAGMAFDHENGFQRAKMFANKTKGIEVDKMIAAIDKLSATYNTVKPENKDK